jgi:hypothetical protein
MGGCVYSFEKRLVPKHSKQEQVSKALKEKMVGQRFRDPKQKKSNSRLTTTIAHYYSDDRREKSNHYFVPWNQALTCNREFAVPKGRANFNLIYYYNLLPSNLT